MLRFTWSCKCCGKQFDELPLAWDFRAPAHYYAIPEAEQAARTQLSEDFCSVDDRAFYVRGLIEVPIIGRPDTLSWGLWASVSAASMKTIADVWRNSDRGAAGPFFGWLCSALPVYPEMFDLKTRMHLRAPPSVPLIELEPTDHPLALEQRGGITIERVVEIAEALLPRH